MKQFLYLFKGGEKAGSPEEMQAIMGKWMAWINDLTEKGFYKGGEPLEEGGKIVQNPNLITDGPFPEAKEIVGGYFLMETKDIDEAAELAKGCPIFETGGTVEVRKVMEM